MDISTFRATVCWDVGNLLLYRVEGVPICLRCTGDLGSHSICLGEAIVWSFVYIMFERRVSRAGISVLGKSEPPEYYPFLDTSRKVWPIIGQGPPVADDDWRRMGGL
jgi:hypothetical protein